MDAGFASLGERILAAINGGGNRSDLIGNADYYFLSYCEFVADATGDNSALVEVFATIIVHPSERRRAYSASANATFHATDYPDFGKLGDVVGPTCLRPIPMQALFGTYSPGFPSPSFMSIIGATGSDIIQKVWRQGRSFEVHNTGKPENEGCMLGVRKAAVKLPAGSALVWTVKVNDQPALVIDNNLNKLN